MNESDSAVVVTRWRRYGKDRLYVTAADGSAVGWHDLVDDVAHPERPELADQLAAAVVGWRGSDAPPETETVTVTAPVEAEPPPEPEQTPEPEPEAERAWQDLAELAPGAQARKQAVELREAAPVRTFVARVFGMHTEERAWRVGAVGEEKVADRLAKLVAKDPRWRVLHAIPVGERGSDIDHLAIGPAGVFTINAKYDAGAKIWVGGDTLLVNGARVPYVRNSRHEARRAGRLLSAATGLETSVTGVVVPVRADDVVVKAQPDGVRVVPRFQLVRWLRRQPEVLDDVTIAAIYEAARRSTTWGT